MTHRILRLTALLAAVAALALTGCGGGDDDGDSASNGAATTTAEDTGGAGEEGTGGEGPTVTMTEFKFSPDSVTVASGESVTADNGGDVGHNLTVRSDGDEVAATDTLEPSKSETLEITASPGEYELVCTVPGHEDAGMVGTLTVE